MRQRLNIGYHRNQADPDGAAVASPLLLSAASEIDAPVPDRSVADAFGFLV